MLAFADCRHDGRNLREDLRGSQDPMKIGPDQTPISHGEARPQERRHFSLDFFAELEGLGGLRRLGRGRCAMVRRVATERLR